ncbi:MAG: hypothetical protein A3G24_08840 [Betaproteobacteria bacterium RIFCSPLOWO2_12_FULL_62_13]|nr:MAG: hypothetical protein A3G24_08840 [Betaproteobacteria bacterium RIFCSPLOWO2_12_FULL_62_13]
MKRTLLSIIATSLGILVWSPAAASEPAYPAKPIRMMVGFGPGGAADILARIVGQRLADAWGQPVVVDNRPGATTTIAAETAARARPDGYTLLTITSAHAVSANLYRKLGYDPVKSFVPVTLIASAPLVLVADPSLRVKSVRDLLEAAKASPGKLMFGSSGRASITHLAGELLKSQAEINIIHVPYKAMSQLMSDVIGGNIQLAFTSIPAGLGQIRAGRILALAVTSLKRSSSLPDVATFAESGVTGFEVTNWYGILVPTGTPRQIVDRLNSKIVNIIRTPDASEAIVKQGAEPTTSSPESFRNYLAAEVTKWAKVVRAAGIQPE